MIVLRRKLLSIIQWNEKKEFFESIDVELICFVLNLTMIDRNRVLLISVRISWKSLKKLFESSSWKINNWKTMMHNSSIKVMSMKSSVSDQKSVVKIVKVNALTSVYWRIRSIDEKKNLREESIRSISELVWKRAKKQILRR